ncbi:MAG: transposase [Kofleriaceae bacterium]|nr:transposase [Kofleriaceae bacterium]MBP9172461.1 transposase [Kofleriaceae bacterium]MBP9862805.1 transposase [Kofleriaceae bacterium]
MAAQALPVTVSRPHRGDIRLDTPRAERTLRKIVVGRKSWLFCC